MASVSSNVKRFIVLGDSGAGKSSFINAFYNYCYGTRNPDEVFGENQTGVHLAIPCKHWLDRAETAVEKSSERNINDQTQSQTMTCTSYTLHRDDLAIELIDTPGFNDSDGVSKDDTILQQIDETLQSIPYLNGIIVVANGTTSRLGTSFQHFMRLLHQVWPNSFMQNMCAVLTNCDEITCNLSSEIRHTDFKVNDATTFYLQNSLFRWDRKDRTGKSIRNFRRDFEDAVATLEKLWSTLARFDSVSTNVFRMGAIKQRGIQECINNLIDKIINLLQVNRLQRVAQVGLIGANATMTANTNWGRNTNITAFKWMEVEPARPPPRSQSIDRRSALPSEEKNEPSWACKALSFLSSWKADDPKNSASTSRERSRIPSSYHRDAGDRKRFDRSAPPLKRAKEECEPPRPEPKVYRREELQLNVAFDDNTIKSHHETAQRAAASLQDETNQFANQRNQLDHALKSLLAELTENVRQMREMNTDIDLLEKNMALIQKLREEIKIGGDEPTQIQLYEEVVRIISKPKDDQP